MGPNLKNEQVGAIRIQEFQKQVMQENDLSRQNLRKADDQLTSSNEFETVGEQATGEK